MRYMTPSAVAVLSAVLSAPQLIHAQHHGGAPPAAREDQAPRRHTESPLNLKDVLKAAERSLGALEKVLHARRVPGPEGEAAVRDYVNLVGWVERRFVAAEEDGVLDARETERARKSLATQRRRLVAMGALDAGPEAAALVAEAREAASAAVAAVDAAVAVAPPQHDHQGHQGHRGGCGHH